MEQKATQEKMIAEYRTWFKIYHKFLKQIKVDESIKAEYAEEYRHELEGMLTLMSGMKVITEEEYETMCKEVKEEFNTPQTPSMPVNTYQKMNDIEKILDDVYGILLNNFNYYCGSEIYAGDDTGLLL